MSTELLPCPFCGGKAEYVSEHDDRCNAAIECMDCGANVGANKPPIGERWNRRTVDTSVAPVSAPLETNGSAIPLPPLPARWQDRSWAHGDPEHLDADDHTNQLLAEIEDWRTVGTSYAERIRHLERELDQALQDAWKANTALTESKWKLERELAERKPASIDTPEFRFLAGRIADEGRQGGAAEEEIAALIAYIDGHTAGTAPKNWKLVPKEPTQAMCDAARAEAMDWQNSGDHWAAMTWFRIYKRMIAAAPSSMSKGKEEA